MPKYNMLYKQEISIHALRVEGDIPVSFRFRQP